MSRALVVLLALGLWATDGPAQAQEHPPDGPRWLAELQLGGAHLMHTRSNAVGHLFKPQLSVSLRHQVGCRYELGGSLLALLDENEHYRVLGVQATARRDLWMGRAFSWGVLLSLGAGYNADILHRDLKAGAPLALYGSLATDVNWRLHGAWQLGARVGLLNVALINLGLTVGRRF